MTPSELIAWYRATGHSMEAIRLMLPAFFDEPVSSPTKWNPLDWFDLWQDPTPDHFSATEAASAGPSLYLHL